MQFYAGKRGPNSPSLKTTPSLKRIIDIRLGVVESILQQIAVSENASTMDVNLRSRREIAPAVVLDTENRFLLQQRDDFPSIVCPGLIGLFGGHREGNETFLECAIRELEEELSCVIRTDRIRFLCSREGDDLEVIGGTIRADFFLVSNISVLEITITEGSLLIVEQTNIASVYDRLTPSAKYAIEFFLKSAIAS